MLEVLVAMSLILGVWITSVGTYQQLALVRAKQESKRSQLRKDMDIFEAQEYTRANHHGHKNLKHDIARVPSRNRAMRNATQSSPKDQR